MFRTVLYQFAMLTLNSYEKVSSGYEQYVIKVSAYHSNKNVAKQGQQKAVVDVAGSEHIDDLKRDAFESGKQKRASPNNLFKCYTQDTPFKNPVSVFVISLCPFMRVPEYPVQTDRDGFISRAFHFATPYLLFWRRT